MLVGDHFLFLRNSYDFTRLQVERGGSETFLWDMKCDKTLVIHTVYTDTVYPVGLMFWNFV